MECYLQLLHRVYWLEPLYQKVLLRQFQRWCRQTYLMVSVNTNLLSALIWLLSPVKLTLFAKSVTSAFCVFV